MKIRLEQTGAWDVVAIEGAMVMTKLSHTPPIFGVLGEKQGARVALDLSRTEAMDSAALSILVSLKKQVQGNNGQLVIVAPSEEIRVLFGIVGFDDRIRVFDSRSDFDRHAAHAGG
jgi:anti-anti-sigma factor